ncbi:hypothetical protein GINT2_000372 [Glugoides intestinalis]
MIKQIENDSQHTSAFFSNFEETEESNGENEAKIDCTSTNNTLSEFPFYSVIKSIWEAHGKKKHETPAEIIQENTSAKPEFSFSPYENFF